MRRKIGEGISEVRGMTLSEGILVAMQAEIEGHEFYKLMASKSKDEGAREMFASLAHDEAEHCKTLGELYGSLVNSGKPPKMRKGKKLSFKSPIFSKEFLGSKKKKNLEMSALSIGMLLEQNAIELYRRQSELATDPPTRKFFDDLIRWEGEHLRALVAQRQFLQREIFSQARFEPF
jgi:rubrerythrin